MRRQIALLWLLLAVFSGCRLQTEKETIRMGVLHGPSALSFVQLLDSSSEVNGQPIEVTVYQTPLEAAHLLIQNKLDLATLPLATAVNLYNKGVDIRIIGCTVWGSFFLLENSAADPTDSPKNRIGLFGKGTTPEMIARESLSTYFETPIPFSFIYTSPTELAQALCSRQIRYAVLPEPFVTAAINRTSDVSILKDLAPHFPQTVVVAQAAFLHKTPDARNAINRLLDRITKGYQTDSLHTIIPLLQQKKLITDTTRTGEMIKRSRIRYIPTEDCRSELEGGVELLFRHAPESLGNQLPDSALYTTDK